MKYKTFRQAYLLFLLIWAGALHTEGFLFNTLVKTISEYCRINELKSSNSIISYCNQRNEQVSTFITKTDNYTADFYIKIILKNTEICCALDQKFYSHNQQKWISAENLTTNDCLTDYNNKPIAIDGIEIISEQCSLYTLSLNTIHTYCVSQYNIITHNAGPVVAIFFPTALSIINPIIQTCLAAGATLIGAHFAKKITCNKSISNTNIDSLPHNYGGHIPDPNDPNNDRNKTKTDEHIHGTYKDAAYHHKNSTGNKSQCPNNGQYCLDHSIPVGKQRIAIEGDSFIVLQLTRPREYHGFKVSWKDLEDHLRAALIKHGFVRKSGKIIRQISEKISS